MYGIKNLRKTPFPRTTLVETISVFIPLPINSVRLFTFIILFSRVNSNNLFQLKSMISWIATIFLPFLSNVNRNLLPGVPGIPLRYSRFFRTKPPTGIGTAVGVNYYIPRNERFPACLTGRSLTNFQCSISPRIFRPEVPAFLNR